MSTWMFFTILAVVMQSVRTAGQKQMAQSLTAEATTLVRFLFGLPFALIYFSLLWRTNSGQEVVLSASYWLPASLATVSQIVATLCLVKALTLRNFAVGKALAKTEAIMTALLGSLFFAASLSVLGYVSVYVGVIGVLVASNWRISVPDLMNNASIKYGLGAGLGFALASLWIRQASLSLAVPELLSAATVLVYMVALQTLICLALIFYRQPAQFTLIANNWRSALFIGFTSVAGSIGWFTAMSLQEAALVKTLGQSEFVVTLFITSLYFGEKITLREYLGMGLIAISVGLLVAAS
jgi:drug/metabolite transporter (DMT)-like permease